MVYPIDPLKDPRWKDFVERHPRSSVFHSVPWLQALERTYNYEPLAFTTSRPEAELQNGFVFCYINSWLTGRRLVSLPFSDHCDLLVDSELDLEAVLCRLDDELRRRRLQYIEYRPVCAVSKLTSPFHAKHSYCLHQLDLGPDVNVLFDNCHKDSTQRKIRRAEREGLTYEEGRSDFLLDALYRLMVGTRRRHRVFPQPKRWFRNLILCFGEAAKIRLVLRHREPIAAILTLQYKDTLVYKYGGSDARRHHLGGMHLLLWKSIQEAKSTGLRVFDMGRSDWTQTGLVTFKDRWGARRSVLTYWRVSARPAAVAIPSGPYRARHLVRRVVQHLPDCLLRSGGALIYRHIG